MFNNKVGFIYGETIAHKRLSESIKILCEKLSLEYYIKTKYNDLNIDALDECGLVFNECLGYKHKRPDQKIVYIYTGAGDLLRIGYELRQRDERVDFVITPYIRLIEDYSNYSKIKMIGNPISLYFDKFYDYVVNCEKDCVLVPQDESLESGGCSIKVALFAKEIAEREGLKVLYKKRCNQDTPEDVFEYLKRAKYVVTGFSSLAFECLCFNIKSVLVKGLVPLNITNNNTFFYDTIIESYEEISVNSYDEFNSIEDEDYIKIKQEHYKNDFIDLFQEKILNV